jgi:hypothetical protein
MAVFPGLNSKIKDAVSKLEEQLVRQKDSTLNGNG